MTATTPRTWSIPPEPEDVERVPQPADQPRPRHTDEQYRAMQDIVIFQSEHIAAITAELDLSYEAETETVLAAIRALATPATDTTQEEP